MIAINHTHRQHTIRPFPWLACHTLRRERLCLFTKRSLLANWLPFFWLNSHCLTFIRYFDCIVFGTTVKISSSSNGIKTVHCSFFRLSLFFIAAHYLHKIILFMGIEELAHKLVLVYVDVAAFYMLNVEKKHKLNPCVAHNN